MLKVEDTSRHGVSLCHFKMLVVPFSVLFYPIGEGKSGQQAVDILLKRLEILGVEKTGNYSVDCDTYQSQILCKTSRTLINNNNNDTLFIEILPLKAAV